MKRGFGSGAGRGLHLTVDRRSLLRSSAILAGAGLIGAGGTPVWSAEAFDDLKAQWTKAAIDWQQQKGKSIVLAGVQHPWMNAIVPLIPHFTRLTGIEVKVQTQAETEYTAELPVKLGAKSTTPDLYMVWAIGQAIQAGWLEPLDPFVANKAMFDPAWWDADDVFSSAREFQKWSDGKQYLMAITAESQILFMNKTMLDAKGLKAPATMAELLETAKALKSADAAGIAMRAKSTGDSTWPVGGFVFSYGGAIIDLDGKVAMNKPEAVAAVDMYGKLLREAGPVGISSYQWAECLNDFMAGATAMGCDSSNFATDIADPKKSTVAGKAVYAMLPKAGDKPIKPNMWHWTAGINSRSANKEAAFLFLAWANSKPTAMLAAAAGLATPRASAWASSAFRDRFGADAADAAMNSLKAGDGALFKATWFHPKGPQILDPLAVAVNEVATGAKDAQKALDDAAAKVQKALG
jgi:multiple sugar transport system substrate-binding protein